MLGPSINTLLQDTTPFEEQPNVDPRTRSAVKWTKVTDDVNLVSKLVDQFYRYVDSILTAD